MSLFTSIHAVAVPVHDQERAKALFEGFGFTTTFDEELQPGFRWIELGLDGQQTVVALVPADPDGLPAGIDTGIRLVTADAAAAHEAIGATGCAPGELLNWEGVPPMFAFTDLDGNRFYVTQAAADQD